MPDINSILQACATYGFPMVMCLILYQGMTKEIKSLTDSVNALTMTVKILSSRIGVSTETINNE